MFHLNLGMTLYYQGRYAEALDAARVAVEQRPDFALAHANLGLALNALGRSDEASTPLLRALDLNPQDVNTFQKLIEILTPQGRYEEAIDLIALAAALAPDSTQAAELHFLMGETAREKGQPETAAEHYVHTLEIDPHHGKTLHWLATLRLEQQRYDEALETFSASHRPFTLKTQRPIANMGIALIFLGRNDEALQHFDQALALDPTLENVRANRETLLKDDGRKC